MKLSDLKTLRNSLSKKVTESFIKKDDNKIRTFAHFINIVADKHVLLKGELELLALKYRDSIYGETFFDMIFVLDANDRKISDDEYASICKDYMSTNTSDEDEYRNMLKRFVEKYGDCNEFFSDEYIESKITREKERYFSNSIKELLDKGYNIDNILHLLEKNNITEFNEDTKLCVNRMI